MKKSASSGDFTVWWSDDVNALEKLASGEIKPRQLMVIRELPHLDAYSFTEVVLDVVYSVYGL